MRTEVHRIIYEELCLGTIRETSRTTFHRAMADLVARGAQAVILGCTEIGLLVGADDTSVPVFDTTRIHAEDAVDWALETRRHAGLAPRACDRRNILRGDVARHEPVGDFVMPHQRLHLEQVLLVLGVVDRALRILAGECAHRRHRIP